MCGKEATGTLRATARHLGMLLSDAMQEGETCLAKQASPGQGAHCSAMAAVKCAGASASRLAAPSSSESASSPSHSASGARPGAAAPAAIAAAGWARPSSSPLPDAWITAAPYQALCCI